MNDEYTSFMSDLESGRVLGREAERIAAAATTATTTVAAADELLWIWTADVWDYVWAAVDAGRLLSVVERWIGGLFVLRWSETAVLCVDFFLSNCVT